MALYKVGDRVHRIENRSVTGAMIISVSIIESNEEVFYELQYDEGGTGWWPEDALRPEKN